MPRLAYKNCKDCGRSSREVGALSWTRLCIECSERHFLENADAMKSMDGPYARHWRQRMAASVGAMLLDDVQQKP